MYCQPVFTGTYPRSGNPHEDFFDTNIGTGNVICFFSRIQKPTERSPGNVWRYTDMVCSIPGHTPKVQVWGNDPKTDGKFHVASSSVFGGTAYGSWSEYGAFSQNQNVNFATGSALAGGGSTDPNSNNPLTFANTGLPATCATGLGCYGTIGKPNSLIAKLQAQCAGNWEGDATIRGWSGGDIVCSTGTVTITRDINNATTIGRLQQKIIVAKDIVINDSVKNIDAWLVALPSPADTSDPWHDTDGGQSGRINTCLQATGDHSFRDILTANSNNRLKTGVCNEKLTINGPVIADQLYLTRTGGGDRNNAEIAAEIINLRADALIWAFNGTSGGSNPVAQTISVRELPPRF
jgi:hypothetical protein